MGKRVDIAERLIELGFDPVEMMVKSAMALSAKNNHVGAAKIAGDLLEYTAPKLKSMEHSIAPDTLDFLDRQQRLERIRMLMGQLKAKGVEVAGEGGAIIDAEFRQLLPAPEPP